MEESSQNFTLIGSLLQRNPRKIPTTNSNYTILISENYLHKTLGLQLLDKSTFQHQISDRLSCDPAIANLLLSAGELRSKTTHSLVGARLEEFCCPYIWELELPKLIQIESLAILAQVLTELITALPETPKTTTAMQKVTIDDVLQRRRWSPFAWTKADPTKITRHSANWRCFADHQEGLGEGCQVHCVGIPPWPT